MNRNTTSPSLTNLSRTSRNRSQNQKGPALHILSLERYYRSDTYIYYGRVLPIITSIVVVLNILLIVTIIKGKFRTSTYVVMVAIAIADCLTGLVPLPFNIYAFGLENETGYLTLSWCYVFDIMQMFLPEVLHESSLHLTVGLAIERFIVVSFPIKAKQICNVRNGIIFSIVIFCVSICSQLDLFIQVEFTPVTIKTRSNATIHGCVRSERIRTNSDYIIRTAFIVFLPCVFLVIFTILLVRKSKKIKKWRKSNSSMKNTVSALDHMNFAVIFISANVLISEVVVWTCLLLSRVNELRFTKTHEDMMAVGLLIFQITSPINFAILCCISDKFRRNFKSVMCCFLWKNKTKNQKKSQNEIFSLQNSSYIGRENTKL